MLCTASPIRPPASSRELLGVMEQLSAAIAQPHDTAAVANLMLDLAISCTAAEKGSLLVFDEEDRLRLLAARGMDPGLPEDHTVRIGEGVAGIVAQQRMPVLVDDINLDDRFSRWRRGRYRTCSFISCPILRSSDLLGVINVNDKAGSGPFTDAEFAIIKAIANLAAVAMENARLLKMIHEKTVALDAATRRLIEKDVARTEFFARIAHELRAPLNTARGAMFYLQGRENISPAEQREFSEIISNETARLAGVVEELLDFQVLEDQARALRKDLLDLPSLVKDVVASSSLAGLARRGVTLRMEEGMPRSEFVGDRVGVVQLLVNLVEGLAGYASAGDHITIGMRDCEETAILFTLSRRIPEAEFDRVFAAPEGRKRVNIFLAKKASEALGWSLEASNTARGCEFSLTLPGGALRKREALADLFLEHALECISELMAVDTCSIMLVDDLTGDLSIRASKGLEDAAAGSRVRMGEGVAGWVAQEGKPLLVSDIEHHPRFGIPSSPRYNTASLLSVPLSAGDRVIGVLNLNNKRSAAPFSRRDLYVASFLGERLGALTAGLRSESGGSRRVARAVSSFDDLFLALRRYHKKGSAMPDLMLRIMERLGAGDDEKMKACYAAAVYDLGLASLPDSVLRSERPAPPDLVSLKAHPFTTVDLLKGLETTFDVRQAILHHHEAYDGSGYPDGLAGETIPLVSRALAVVDAFCAMTSGSPHRPAPLPDQTALEEIRRESGTRFDPVVVRALESVLASA